MWSRPKIEGFSISACLILLKPTWFLQNHEHINLKSSPFSNFMFFFSVSFSISPLTLVCFSLNWRFKNRTRLGLSVFHRSKSIRIPLGRLAILVHAGCSNGLQTDKRSYLFFQDRRELIYNWTGCVWMQMLLFEVFPPDLFDLSMNLFQSIREHLTSLCRLKSACF